MFGEKMNKIAALIAFAFIIAMPIINASQFSLIDVAWGAHNVSGPIAGQQNVPLVVTMQNLQCATLKNVTLTLSLLGSDFAAANGQSSITESVAEVGPNQQFTYTFYVNVLPSISGGMQYLNAHIAWESPSSVSLNCTSPASAYYYINSPYYFTLPVYFGGISKLKYSQNVTQLAIGTVNNVTLYISNIGTGNASQIDTEIGLGQSKAVVLKQPGTIANLSPGETKAVNFTVAIPGNFSGSTLLANVSSTFINGSYAYQNERSTMAFLVPAKLPLLITQNNTTIYIGGTKTVSIGITNNGASPIYSLQAALTPQNMSSSSLAVTKGNLAYYSVIEPGQTVYFTPSITTSPSASEGGYNIGLSISYQDQTGAQQSQRYNVGLLVVPRLSVVLNGVTAYQATVSNAIGMVTVSGDAIDEGSDNVNYAEVYAYIIDNGKIISENSTYIGEILTDSPTAFTVPLAYPLAYTAGQHGFNASSNASRNYNASRKYAQGNYTAIAQNSSLKVGVYVVYQNDFGSQIETNTSTYEVSAPSFSTFIAMRFKKGNPYADYEYAAAIIAIAIIAVVAYKRHRKRKKLGNEEKRKERRVT